MTVDYFHKKVPVTWSAIRSQRREHPAMQLFLKKPVLSLALCITCQQYYGLDVRYGGYLCICPSSVQIPHIYSVF